MPTEAPERPQLVESVPPAPVVPAGEPVVALPSIPDNTTLEKLANIEDAQIVSVQKDIQRRDEHGRVQGQNVQLAEHNAREIARARREETRAQRSENVVARAVKRLWKQTLFSGADYGKEKAVAIDQIAAAGVQVEEALPHSFYRDVNIVAQENIHARRERHERGAGNRFTDFVAEATFQQKRLHEEQTAIIGHLRQAALMSANERAAYIANPDNRDAALTRFLTSYDQRGNAAAQTAHQAQVNTLVTNFRNILTGDFQAGEALARRAGKDIAESAIRCAVGEKYRDGAVKLDDNLTKLISKHVLTPLYETAAREGRVVTEDEILQAKAHMQEVFFTKEFAQWRENADVRGTLDESLSYGSTLVEEFLKAKEHIKSTEDLETYKNKIVLKVNIGTLRAGPQTTINESYTERVSARNIRNQDVINLYRDIAAQPAGVSAGENELRSGRRNRQERVSAVPDAILEAASNRSDMLRGLHYGLNSTGKTVVAVGVGVGIYAAQRALGGGANLIAPIVGAAAVRGAFAARTEANAVTREAEVKAREEARGHTTAPDSRRRERLPSMPIVNLENGIVEPLNEFVKQITTNPGAVSDDELFNGLAVISDFSAREQIRNDQEHVEMYGVKLGQNFDAQVTEAYRARQRATEALAKYFAERGADPAVARQFTDLNTNLGIDPRDATETNNEDYFQRVVDDAEVTLMASQEAYLVRGQAVEVAFENILDNVALEADQLTVEESQRAFRAERNRRAAVRGLTAAASTGIGAWVSHDIVNGIVHGATEAVHHVAEGHDVTTTPDTYGYVPETAPLVQEGNVNLNIPSEWQNFKPDGQGGFTVTIGDNLHNFHREMFDGHLRIVDTQREYVLNVNQQTLSAEDAINVQADPTMFHSIEASDINMVPHSIYGQYDGVNYAGYETAGHWNEMPVLDQHGNLISWQKVPGATSFGGNAHPGDIPPHSAYVDDPNKAGLPPRSEWKTDAITDKVFRDTPGLAKIGYIAQNQIMETADLPNGQHLIGFPDQAGIVHWPAGTMQEGTVFHYGYFTQQDGDLTKFVDVAHNHADVKGLTFQELAAKTMTKDDLPHGSTTITNISVDKINVVHGATPNAEIPHAATPTDMPDLPGVPLPSPYIRRPMEAPAGADLPFQIVEPDQTPTNPEPEPLTPEQQALIEAEREFTLAYSEFKDALGEVIGEDVLPEDLDEIRNMDVITLDPNPDGAVIEWPGRMGEIHKKLRDAKSAADGSDENNKHKNLAEKVAKVQVVLQNPRLRDLLDDDAAHQTYRRRFGTIRRNQDVIASGHASDVEATLEVGRLTDAHRVIPEVAAAPAAPTPPNNPNNPNANPGSPENLEAAPDIEEKRNLFRERYEALFEKVSKAPQEEIDIFVDTVTQVAARFPNPQANMTSIVAMREIYDNIADVRVNHPLSYITDVNTLYEFLTDGYIDGESLYDALETSPEYAEVMAFVEHNAYLLRGNTSESADISKDLLEMVTLIAAYRAILEQSVVAIPSNPQGGNGTGGNGANNPPPDQTGQAQPLIPGAVQPTPDNVIAAQPIPPVQPIAPVDPTDPDRQAEPTNVPTGQIQPLEPIDNDLLFDPDFDNDPDRTIVQRTLDYGRDIITGENLRQNIEVSRRAIEILRNRLRRPALAIQEPEPGDGGINPDDADLLENNVEIAKTDDELLREFGNAYFELYDQVQQEALSQDPMIMEQRSLYFEISGEFDRLTKPPTAIFNTPRMNNILDRLNALKQQGITLYYENEVDKANKLLINNGPTRVYELLLSEENLQTFEEYRVFNEAEYANASDEAREIVREILEIGAVVTARRAQERYDAKNHPIPPTRTIPQTVNLEPQIPGLRVGTPEVGTAEMFELKLSTQEQEQLMQQIEIRGDAFLVSTNPNDERNLTPEDLRNAGLLPKYEIKAEDATVLLSSPYHVDGDRVSFVGYVKTDTGYRARTFYLSQSQGVWRYLPKYLPDGTGVSWFHKGYSEESITLPIPLQQALNTVLTTEKNPLNLSGNPYFYFAGTARNINTSRNITYQIEVGETPTKFDAVIEANPRYINGNANKLAPNEIVFEHPENDIPDFSNPITTWQQTTSLYGDITIEVYQSHNEKLRYMFCTDQKGRSWIGGIETNDKIQSVGLRSQWVNGGDLTTPAYEYTSQVGKPENANYSDRKGHYVDMYENYIRHIPLIQEYENMKRAQS